MAKAIIDEQNLTDIADAIRAKNGSADTYLPSEMATAIGDLPTPTTVTKGLVFSDYDNDGYPTKAEFVGSWTEIPNNYCHTLFWNNLVFTKNITSIIIPDTVSLIWGGAFENCKTLTNIEFPNNDLELKNNNCFNECNALQKINIKGNLILVTGISAFKNCKNATEVTVGGHIGGNGIGSNTFNGCVKVELYDFSHCTSVPPLYSVASLGHASGCVIKVPSALLSTWQTTAVWKDLTGVVWQGV